MKTLEKSDIAHYYVNDILFILFDEAMEYCDEQNLSYSAIEKTYYYK